MKTIFALALIVASASATGLLNGAPLLAKVQVAPAQVSVVKQPIHVQEPYSVPRSVPYPVRAVAYTAPVVHSPVVAPALAYADAPAPALAYAAHHAPAFAYAPAHPAAYAAYGHHIAAAPHTIALAH